MTFATKYCHNCSGPVTRSAYASEQPADSPLCAPCWYNESEPVKLLTLDELDDLTDHVPDDYQGLLNKALEGRLVDWHSEIVPISVTERGLRLRVTMRCARCDGFPIEVWAASGLHNGAWPYIYDDDNNFLGCIRDDEYRCEQCTTELAAIRA